MPRTCRFNLLLGNEIMTVLQGDIMRNFRTGINWAKKVYSRVAYKKLCVQERRWKKKETFRPFRAALWVWFLVNCIQGRNGSEW
ncbi:putative transposon-encoded protein with DNA/RNA polymerase superfamily and reverse transcriptase domains [Klebsormidium nitens]|uniref:Putative transposon-encoded protein with DNA/RNA polymerase superfamily and reverse transcriptase domains n=1 Tax=Klebsormidium nitens TaxID=105231 RepID=A0A1Y1ID34_KLENI|nr:putative transposon-encoded protein with DNA/RNA polymerase superfamily and reverse transcriptase domains [Klebsormidium nitens]|eukprot:GAQ87852.1 putative transposon-encoded protein with DNA/RNA polymerase superfamily and reverse transcriptase domains [Klebsormidium nitens]